MRDVTAPAEDAGDLGRREVELRLARRANLASLREKGADPFRATHFDVTAHAADLIERYADLTAESEPATDLASIAGRLMSVRKMGKGAIWADLWDRTGKLQVYVRKDALGDDAFALFDTLDLGDIVGVTGTLFRSKSGELTLRASAFAPLSKSLVPQPDKWHGLQDVEKRYRQRYVDLMMNEHVREIFLTRSKIVSEMRRFCDAKGFVECETPTMLHVAGGAAARPFRTHHNALDIDLDLRIATELNLKRLIVGGLERVYEIGRIFRNEGIDATHNPEFTMLELYAAYWSVHEMMDFNEELFAHLMQVVRGSTELTYGEKHLSFARPFRRIGYFEAIELWGGFDRATLLDPAGAQRLLEGMGLPASPTHGQALDKIFERVVEPHLVDPTFVYDYPVVISPLAKRKAGDPDIVDRYELFGANFELSNAFTELNDPDDQRARFEAQIVERKTGNDEVPPPDWDFVSALEYGMPPTAGIGIGVDRIVMLLTNQQSIREVILFPLQRPVVAIDDSDLLVAQARSLLDGESDAIANAANISALIFSFIDDLNWAGFYFIRGGELVLGPFQGKTACTRIAKGRGVCGAAWESHATVVVPDVHEFPGHIACDSASQSEVVVPLFSAGRIVGVLDVDSPRKDRFSPQLVETIEAIAQVYMGTLESIESGEIRD